MQKFCHVLPSMFDLLLAIAILAELSGEMAAFCQQHYHHPLLLFHKNIIEFNDFSYTTVIKCYLLLYLLFYIPWLVSYTIMLVRINCGCCVRSVPFVNWKAL